MSFVPSAALKQRTGGTDQRDIRRRHIRTNRLVIQKILNTTGLEIIFTQDGSEAVQQFVTHQPDLVLMDISMTKLMSIEETEGIRSFETENGLLACPIIAFTAKAMIGDREKCLKTDGRLFE